MSKVIMFDMDGTVYDLYGVDNWLEKLENSDWTGSDNAARLLRHVTDR